MDRTLIEIKHLNKTYGEQGIFQNFTLEIDEHESLAVVGESGCGKTTLLRILAGLDDEFDGEILVNGKDVRKTAPDDRDMALVFQEPALWNHMTVRENILFPIERKQWDAVKGKLKYICQKLEIAELLSRYPDEISGGQAKRVSLARALISEKQILLLDEPLSNIDGDTREKVLSFLREEYVGKYTIIYVSHDMHEVESISDRVITL